MEQKIYKPKSCELCPVVKIEKGVIICGAYKSLKAKTNDSTEKYDMWKKCPIGWDK